MMTRSQASGWGWLLPVVLSLLVACVFGAGSVGANNTGSIGLGLTVIDSSTETPEPTVTPTAPPATKTPNTPSNGGGPVTKLPATGGTSSTDSAVVPVVLLLAGGSLLALGWRTHRQAA